MFGLLLVGGRPRGGVSAMVEAWCRVGWSERVSDLVMERRRRPGSRAQEGGEVQGEEGGLRQETLAPGWKGGRGSRRFGGRRCRVGGLNI